MWEKGVQLLARVLCCLAMYPSTSPACFEVKSLLRPALSKRAKAATEECAACSLASPHISKEPTGNIAADRFIVLWFPSCGFGWSGGLIYLPSVSGSYLKS